MFGSNLSISLLHILREMSGFLRACHIMIFCGGVCVERICFSSDKKRVKLCISGWSGMC